jgi:glycosyltransferase involved in cell wall biosynthesis
MKNPQLSSIKVKVVYRNYKPLHQLYASYFEAPPKGVAYTIPQAKGFLKKFLPIYKKHGDNPVVKVMVKVGQRVLFAPKTDVKEDFDLYEFVQIVPEYEVNKPYIVDIEHFIGLVNFVDPDKKALDKAYKFLANKNCKAVVCLSAAAKKTILLALGKKKYKKIEKKVHVVYPALPNLYEKYHKKINYSVVNPKKGFNMIMLGNMNIDDTYRKGLHEILEAAKRLREQKYKINVHLAHNAAAELKKKYNYTWAKFYMPAFKHDEKMWKLFIPADVFIMPTHGDTFGMVFLEALASATPVIAINQFATPELVKNGKTGYLVRSAKRIMDEHLYSTKTIEKTYFSKVPEEVVVKDLMAKIKLLYENPKLAKQLGKNALKDFKKGGKFAVETRNEKLAMIYKKALE